MEFIKVKTILNKVKYGSSWYGIGYNMNLYRGCCHGCIYCDSRSQCYHIAHFDKVKGKENALQILEKELMSKRSKGIIGIGSMSDTYNPLEMVYKQTRSALKLIHQYGFGVSIDTKSDLILRDIDLLKKINAQNNVIIKFTITTPSDKLSKIIEPNVCETSKRLHAIKILSDNGLFVGIMMNPVLPFITDNEDDVRELVKLASQAGAKFIHTYMGTTLRDVQRDYYFERLDEYFIGLKQEYIRFYKDMYNCVSIKHERLYQVFINECKKYDILYDMKDIIKAYKKEIKHYEQLALFK